MPWLQVRLAITPEQAETYEDALLEVGAVSVTFMDAEDQPIFEPDLGTTPLCLEWLDGEHLQDCSVIDFGCGSGILAIAALLLGAPTAVGTDIDPQALEASRDNAGRNGIDPARFPVFLPADMPQEQADVVVANILAGPLVALAAQITALVKPGGRLALSGILAEQADEVRAAYNDAFILDPTAVKDGWVRISGVRR